MTVLEFVSADDLVIGVRQRQDFDVKKIEELRSSILDVGLIHAPVVTEDLKLVAGERRLRALENQTYFYGNVECTWPEIPVHITKHDDPRTLFKIELDENLRRVNLTPMEQANAIAALHSVQAEVHPGHTMKETAKELAQIEGKVPTQADEARVAMSIIVDQFKDDPDVQKAAKISLKKAYETARKKAEIELTRVLGNFEEKEEHEFFTLLEGDCVQLLEGFEEDTFDILFFDPPYGMGADSFGDAAMSLGHQYEDSLEFAEQLISAIIRHPSIKRTSAHALMFCNYENFERWKELYTDASWKVWPRPFIWFKGQQAHVPRPGYGPRYSYECLLFASRGDRTVRSTINDVLQFPPTRDKIHAAEKPAELLAYLIDFVAAPGDKILDPTCGSGSIFTAARGKEVYVAGIELSSDYAGVAKNRIQAGGGEGE